MNFDMAAEMCGMEDITVKTVLVTDDIASATLDKKKERRGVAGDFYVFKVAGAAAQNMMLACSAMGFYSIWRTGHLAFNKYINKSLKLKKSDVVIGYLYIGSSTKKIPSPKKLKIEKFVKKLG